MPSYNVTFMHVEVEAKDEADAIKAAALLIITDPEFYMAIVEEEEA